MVARVEVRLFDALPHDISILLEAERAEGHRLVLRLAEEWNDGSNRFDQPGEVVLDVRSNGRLVGVGGLNRDPYLDDPTVGRLRYVYVSSEVRGQGVGRLLVERLVDHAREGFDRVRLRTVTTGGSAFYVALGFEEIDEPNSTHQISF